MTKTLTREQDCLLGLARDVWDKRGQAKAAGLPYNEETVTERFLLELRLHWPGQVTIVALNKYREAATGADWAWSFVSADGAWSQSMLVQAKRLDDMDHRYGGISQEIGRRKVAGEALGRQIDRLIDTAAGLGIPAVYAFYNHLANTGRVPDNCGSLRAAGIRTVDSWGVALAAAEEVRDLLPDDTFDGIRNHSMPLHCLLCSGGTGIKREGGSARAANTKLAQLFVDGGMGSAMRGAGGLARGLPGLLEALAGLGSEEDAATTGESSQLQGLAREFPGLAGVVIFRDSATETGPVRMPWAQM